MVTQGDRGSWRPSGPGLLVAVVVLAAVALTVHAGVALALVGRAVARDTAVAGGAPTVSPTTSSIAASTSSSTPASSGTSTTAAGAGGLHIDHACLVSDNPATGATIPSDDPFGTDLSALGDKVELQRLYAVQNGQLTAKDGVSGVRSCDEQLWQLVTATAPANVRGYLDEFLVFDADVTSGNDFYVGEVESQEGSPQRAAHWRMSLAPNGATDVDVALTVAHEVGHLISLNADEMTGATQFACAGTYIDEGCLKDDGALNTFLEDTWTDDDWHDFNKAADVDDKTKRDQALKAFYDKHSASFVDSYAATDPAEDFAESFATWCAVAPDNPILADLVEGNPTNGAAKLAWFNRSGNPVAAQTRAQCERLRQFTR